MEFAGKSNEPGPARSHSFVVGEEVRNLRGAGDLFGDTQLLAYFKASKARANRGLLRGVERSGK